MRRALGIIAVLLALAGTAVLAYQPFMAWQAQQERAQTLEEFDRMLEQTEAVQNTAASGGAQQDGAGGGRERLLEDMQAYNRALFETGQSDLSDAWSYEQPVFDLREYGLETDVIGSIRIPAMEVELPVYLGATEENMARGAVVLGQTSMPVGGENTNCVIAGHRGYRSEAFFREIEELAPGDRIYLTTIFGELEYEVDSMAVIEPDNIDAVKLQAGKEMLTLVTCHPYTVGSHRYIVYCDAVDSEMETETGNQTKQESEHRTETYGTENDSVLSGSRSQKMIWLEKRLPFVAIPLLILIVILLIWPKAPPISGSRYERQDGRRRPGRRR